MLHLTGASLHTKLCERTLLVSKIILVELLVAISEWLSSFCDASSTHKTTLCGGRGRQSRKVGLRDSCQATERMQAKFLIIIFIGCCACY